MSFFEVDQGPPEPEPRPVPQWANPPRLVFPGVLPVTQVVASSEKGVVAFIEIRAFELGCVFDIDACVVAPTDPAERLRLTTISNFVSRPVKQLPDEMLRFGVEFADGTKATTVDRAASWLRRDQETEPEGPVLRSAGSRGGHSDPGWVAMGEPLWLWPLPPRERFDLVVEWPVAGIGLTRFGLDGEAIVDAAARARPFVDRRTGVPVDDGGAG